MQILLKTFHGQFKPKRFSLIHYSLVSNRILQMSEASHVEGLVTMLLYLAGLNLMEGELTIKQYNICNVP